MKKAKVKQLRKPDPEEVTLVIKGVSAEARVMFNELCSSINFAELSHPKPRGEILSELIMKAAKEELTPHFFDIYLEGYREQQNWLIQEHNKLSNTPDPPNLTN